MLGEYTLAMRLYRRAIELRPESAMAYANLGAIHLAAGQFDDAEQMLVRAVELQPSHAQAHYNLGLVYLQTGRLSQARGHVLRARTFGLAPSPEVAAALGI
jgi:Flp pilus assembly protein TadD